MRLATIRTTGLTPLDAAASGALERLGGSGDGAGTAACRIEGDQAVLLSSSDVGSLLANPDWRSVAAGADGGSVPLDEADFAPLVPHPEKVLCIGVNYQSHLDEVGLERPEYPTVFAKYSRALIGPRDFIELPASSRCADWEVELAVVIGTPLRHAGEAEALAGVAGYTIFNDVTMRDWQFRTSQYLQGKTFEKTTPVGPYLVTPEEVGHAEDLRLSCAVDGQVMQDASTNELLFPVGFLLSYLSSFITLAPGDVIATGTPSGVGGARQPAVYLQPGQVLTTSIAGLGELRNTCVPDPHTPTTGAGTADASAAAEAAAVVRD